MLKYAFLIFALMIIGCGKSSNSQETVQLKTEEEILAIKYNKPFELKCAIRTIDGNIFSSLPQPVDEFQWPLDEEPPLMRIFQYKVGKEKLIVVVKVTERPEIEPFVSHRTENGSEYYMENSPVLKIQYRRAPVKVLTNGTIHDKLAYKEVTLFENIEERIFTIPSEVDEGLITDDFRCTLITEMNPAFRAQWRRIK